MDDLYSETRHISKLYTQVTRYESDFSAPSSQTRTVQTAPLVKGLLYSNALSNRYLQVSIDGFTLSALHPYGGWESLRDEARALFTYYTHQCRPVAISRVGLRYINEIHLAVGTTLDRYLNVYAFAKFTAPPKVESFYLQLLMSQDDDIATQLVMTQATMPSPDGIRPAVALDLDIRADGQRAVADTDSLFLALEVLHARVYSAFRKATTEGYQKEIS